MIERPLANQKKVALGCRSNNYSNERLSSLYSATGDSKPDMPASIYIGIIFIKTIVLCKQTVQWFLSGIEENIKA
ncbi:hypothetical protein GCM10011501_33200 [Thalassotalea profundi]|uniref:Uncharacterized protein n=1 Tax=Thalassotalea profundi TaxID=2036687 RepID=A0ABQ3J1B4_9GAMM|nr:hypothetical protein GCM10011501_33200 [Thalassotalea profundi]